MYSKVGCTLSYTLHVTCYVFFSVLTPLDDAFSYIHVDRSKQPFRVTVIMGHFGGGRPTAFGQIDETNGLVQRGYVIFPDDRRYNFWYYTEEAVIYWDHDKGKTTNIWRGLRGGKLHKYFMLTFLYDKQKSVYRLQ